MTFCFNIFNRIPSRLLCTYLKIIYLSFINVKICSPNNFWVLNVGKSLKKSNNFNLCLCLFLIHLEVTLIVVCLYKDKYALYRRTKEDLLLFLKTITKKRIPYVVLKIMRLIWNSFREIDELRLNTFGRPFNKSGGTSWFILG